MNIFVQFTDSSKTTICGVFSCAQPDDVVPVQGVLDASDPRYKAWWEALLPGTMTGNLPVPTA